MAHPRPTVSLLHRVSALTDAFGDLLRQEFGPSVGHLSTLLHGCVFAPSLLTFWLVNGVLDFSTAFVVGAVAGPGGLVVRLGAYLLLVPGFVALRATYYLLHPRHRRTLLDGACPQSRALSLDWFSVGILATGLPLALADLGPWIGMNAVFLLGLFLLPPALRPERRPIAKLGAVLLGVLVFAYGKYGGLLVGLWPVLPEPAAVLGPVATATLAPGTVDLLLAHANALLTGPPLVAAFAGGMNWVLTRPSLQDIPVVGLTLPRPDPPSLVVWNAALGTVFYLLVVAAATGRLVVVP